MKPRDSDQEVVTVSCEQLACSNALILQSLLELLSEKGVCDWKEVQERVQRRQLESADKRSAWEVFRRPRSGCK
jgi:hypothetical protein